MSGAGTGLRDWCPCSALCVLAGGIGGARFLRGLRSAVPDAEITVVGNTGDDIHLFGLKVCPDLDTVMYTLGGGIHEKQGWGRAGETFAVKEELAAYGVGPEWFGLGDRDFATHIVRTQMISAGYPLSAVTEALCARWQPGVRLLPMTDDRVETHVLIDDPDAGDSGRDEDGGDGTAGRKAVHFQEYWVRLRASVDAHAVVPVGADAAEPRRASWRPSPRRTRSSSRRPTPSSAWARSWPSPASGRRSRTPGYRSSASRPSSGTPPCTAWRTRCWPPWGSRPRRRPSPRTTVRDCWTAGWSTPWTPTPWRPSRTRASRCRAVPLLMRDEETTAEMARQALALAEGGTRVTAVTTGASGQEQYPRATAPAEAAEPTGRERSGPGTSYEVWALPGIPDVRPGDDLVRLLVDAAAAPGGRGGWRTATCSSSPRRS